MRVRRWQSKQDFLDFEHRLEELSRHGDPLAKLTLTVSFEAFGVLLVRAHRRSDPRKGGRPAYDAVLKFIV